MANYDKTAYGRALRTAATELVEQLHDAVIADVRGTSRARNPKAVLRAMARPLVYDALDAAWDAGDYGNSAAAIDMRMRRYDVSWTARHDGEIVAEIEGGGPRTDDDSDLEHHRHPVYECIHGLPSIVPLLVEAAAEAGRAKGVMWDLDPTEILRKIPGMRVSLSRRGYASCWIAERDHELWWQIHVLVRKAESDSAY